MLYFYKFLTSIRIEFLAVFWRKLWLIILILKTGCVCFYIMREERILCMFCTCQERTFDQEQTHSMSAVGFGFGFGLVILENLRIDHKIVGVVCVRSSARGIKNISQIIYIQTKICSWSKPIDFIVTRPLIAHLSLYTRPKLFKPRWPLDF